MNDRQLDAYLAARRAEVEAALRAELARGRGWPARLAQAMRYALLGGGKRIRPVLVLSAADALGGAAARRRALGAACALEMIHAYSLVHDDLPAMDDDELRRGRPTVHVRFGEALAILTGDALLTEAFAALARPGGRGASPEQRVALVAEIAQAAGAAGMVAGQVADIACEGRRRVGLETVAAIHRRKTGALIRAAVRTGAICGGASAGELSRLTSYGEALGLAFQIADDVLDAAGPSALTGKRPGGDAARGKATYPALLGLDGARAAARGAGERARRALRPLGARGVALEALASRVVERAA